MTSLDARAQRSDDRSTDLAFTALLLSFALPMGVAGGWVLFLELEGSTKAVSAFALLLPAVLLAVLVLWVLRNPLHDPARRPRTD